MYNQLSDMNVLFGKKYKSAQNTYSSSKQSLRLSNQTQSYREMHRHSLDQIYMTIICYWIYQPRLIIYHIIILSWHSMQTTSSPFLNQMQQCRQTMRKLRKKIYKTCRNTQYPAKKLKDNTEEIMDIFHNRNIPGFVTQALRKRRNFDLKSIKNILVTTVIPLQDIQNRTVLQQKQVENIYGNHKKRFEEIKKKQEEKRVLGEVMYQLSTDNVYSSTNEDECFRPIQAHMIEISHSQSQQAIDALYPDSSHQEREPTSHQDYFDFNINESSLHQNLAFLNF